MPGSGVAGEGIYIPQQIHTSADSVLSFTHADLTQRQGACYIAVMPNDTTLDGR